MRLFATLLWLAAFIMAGCDNGDSKISWSRKTSATEEQGKTPTDPKGSDGTDAATENPSSKDVQGEEHFDEDEMIDDTSPPRVDTEITTPALGVTRTGLPENDTLPAEKRQFLWPVDGWVSANNAYYSGGVHTGSADIATPYWMPVIAARHGEVAAIPDFSAASGWSITIKHELGYSTEYSHLMVKPSLKVGDKVEAGAHIGHVGRTGNAPTSMLHFSIYRAEGNQNELIHVPGLTRGIWIKQGTFIPGSYNTLSAINSYRASFKMKVAEDNVQVHASHDQDSQVIETLANKQEVTVVGTHNGYFRLTSGGWVVNTTLAFSPLQPYSLIVTKATSVYVFADDLGPVYSQVEPNTLITGFSAASGWERVIHRKTNATAALRYVRSADVERTTIFTTRIGMGSVNLRAGPGVQFQVVANVKELWKSGTFTILDVRDGWYKFVYNGREVWIAGWLTTGRI